MIGLTIAKLLNDDAALLALVPTDNIFPYIANPDTPLPIIIYGINELSANYTKDGWANDVISFSIVCFSEDYENLQAIVYEVRNALEMESDTNTGRITVTGMKEDFDFMGNAFRNTLSFQIGVKDY